jgi:hypothetical protein
MPEEFTDIIEDLYEIYNVAAFNEDISLEDIQEFEIRLKRMQNLVQKMKAKKIYNPGQKNSYTTLSQLAN